jgi:NIMA (never in mitosis gene a)-related kinase
MPWDDYEKVREIFLGTFGRTFLVRRLPDNKLLAMKEIDFACLTRIERRDALDEVAILASLKHPFLIRYCEKFFHDSQLCMIADDCDEGTLWNFTRLCNRQRAMIPESQVLRWFAQICLAVKYLHERPQPILHRDIKMQNVFIVKEKEGSGLGCAKLFAEFGPMRILETPDSLVQGQVGTHYCQSPEICSRLPYGTPADVWALGCILYELCTAPMNWEAQDIPEHIENILIAPLSMISGSYSCELGYIATALLTHQPNDRPSASSVLKTPLLQDEMRKMLDDRHKCGAKQADPHGARDVFTKGSERSCPDSARKYSARSQVYPPSSCGRNTQIPRSARSASPMDAQEDEICYTKGLEARGAGDAAYRSIVRPLGEHNPRMPRTARSASPNEAAKLMLGAAVPSSPRMRAASRSQSPYREMQEIAAKLLLGSIDV